MITHTISPLSCTNLMAVSINLQNSVITPEIHYFLLQLWW